MDNYPEHLAPDFDEAGAVSTPFDEWWARVQPHFPNVPENAARYWLHEHWGHSPYRWLPSREYRFRLVEWAAADLPEIKSRHCRWKNEGCLKHGGYLMTLEKYLTQIFMLEHGDFPQPIVILDNRDGHLEQGRGGVPPNEDIPREYVLIEGHRRFNISLYLNHTGQIKPSVKVWLMEHERA